MVTIVPQEELSPSETVPDPGDYHVRVVPCGMMSQRHLMPSKLIAHTSALPGPFVRTWGTQVKHEGNGERVATNTLYM